MRWVLLLLFASPLRADETCRSSEAPGCAVKGLLRLVAWVARLPATMFHEAVEPELLRQLESGAPLGARSVQDRDGRTRWVLDFAPVADPDRYRRH